MRGHFGVPKRLMTRKADQLAVRGARCDGVSSGRSQANLDW